MREFTGDSDTFTLEQFDIHVEALKKYNRWSDRETGEIVGFHLMGEALDSMDPTKLGEMKWADMKDSLYRHFRPSGREPLLRAQLQQCQRKDGDTLAQYAAKLRRLGRMAYPGGLTNPQSQFALVDVFVRGQGDKVFQREAYTHNVSTLDEALALAERSEAGQRSIDVTWPSKPRKGSEVRSFGDHRSDEDKGEALIARMVNLLDQRKKEDAGQVASANPNGSSQGNGKSVNWGNRSREGNRSRDSSVGRNGSRSSSKDRGPVRCYKCQGYGHFANECPSTGHYEIGKDGTATQVNRDGARRSSRERDDPKAKGGQVRSPDTPPK